MRSRAWPEITERDGLYRPVPGSAAQSVAAGRWVPPHLVDEL